MLGKSTSPSPTIEDVFKEKLAGKNQQNALDFIAFLRKNEMSPKVADENCWTFSYSDGAEHVCVLCIYPDEDGIGWTIFDNPLTSKYDDFQVDEKLKEFALANVKICAVSQGLPCGCGNEPGRRKTVFGKVFDNVCTSEVGFRNPDDESLKKIMQMLDIWKLHIDTKL